MLLLVNGASGLIGSALVARLLKAGHHVRAVARSAGGEIRSGLEWVRLDMAVAGRATDWLPYLANVDAVVNCAGALQDGPKDDIEAVHAEGAAALFQACERAGVRRVVHFSAMGIDRATPTPFSRTKRAGDEALMACQTDWVILRPSVVLGHPVYGASALIRGLAALPLLPVMPNTGPLQPVRLEDVVETALFFVSPEAPAKVVVELAGPERLRFEEIVGLYRRWLGYGPARTFPVQAPAADLLYGLGDLAGRLGWRPPLRSTAKAEIARGAIGDPSAWMRLMGIRPQSLEAALAEQPATVQERWFAALYLAKPVVFVTLALFWIGSGIASLGPGYSTGLAMMREADAGALAVPTVIAGGLVDLAVGCGIAWRQSARTALWAGMIVSALYAAAGTLLLPELWIDPMAPLLKIAPILALMLVALAILRDR